jgi:putative PIN family toxin of toxin-antitoxin system
MRVVLDTNVLISALLFDSSPEKVVLSTLNGLEELILSPYIVAETTRILEDKFGVEPSSLELLQQLLSEAELVYFQPFLNVIEDEPDNRILETAVKGKASYLVTGDKLLLKLKRYKDIKIVSVKEFLEVIES